MIGAFGSYEVVMMGTHHLWSMEKLSRVPVNNGVATTGKHNCYDLLCLLKLLKLKSFLAKKISTAIYYF